MAPIVAAEVSARASVVPAGPRQWREFSVPPRNAVQARQRGGGEACEAEGIAPAGSSSTAGVPEVGLVNCSHCCRTGILFTGADLVKVNGGCYYRQEYTS